MKQNTTHKHDLGIRIGAFFRVFTEDYGAQTVEKYNFPVEPNRVKRFLPPRSLQNGNGKQKFSVSVMVGGGGCYSVFI